MHVCDVKANYGPVSFVLYVRVEESVPYCLQEDLTGDFKRVLVTLCA